MTSEEANDNGMTSFEALNQSVGITNSSSKSIILAWFRRVARGRGWRPSVRQWATLGTDRVLGGKSSLKADLSRFDLPPGWPPLHNHDAPATLGTGRPSLGGKSSLKADLDRFDLPPGWPPLRSHDALATLGTYRVWGG